MIALIRRSARAAAFAFSLVVVCAGAPSVAGAQQEDAPVVFSDNDPEMNAAIAEARARFPIFVDLAGRHPDGMFFLKVAIPHANGHEHVWMALVDVTDEGFSGVIVNEVAYVAYEPGDAYMAAPDQISDWMVQTPPAQSGPIYGGYTLRVIEQRRPGSLPPEFRARMQPL